MNRSYLRGSFLWISLLTGLCSPDSTVAAPDQKPTDKVFVGYLFGQPRKINFRLYTHLCHAFVTADAEGNLKSSRSVPNRELVSDAHKAGVKVLVSLGGWGGMSNSLPSFPSRRRKNDTRNP